MSSLGSRDIWNHLDSLTKPPRSLGRLEDLAARLCEIQQTLTPQTAPRRIVLFAGDHGVVGSGVSAWPSEVTRLMVQNLRAGGAAGTVLARQTQTDGVLIDVGVIGDASADDGPSRAERPGMCFRRRRIREGTRDLSLEPRHLPDEFEAAINAGRDEAKRAASDGMCVVAAGEMGIGNTTPSACVAMLLADVPLGDAVGRARGPMTPRLAVSAGSSTRPSLGFAPIGPRATRHLGGRRRV